jgi:Holliday junction resolvasome RuvABC endonuclease subunit
MQNINDETDDFLISERGTHIGIDYSITSTGMCIIENKNYLFFWFPKIDDKTNLKKYDDIKSFATIIPYVVSKENVDYTTQAIKNINNAHILAKAILNILKDYDKSIPINIEGFSFASVGASFIDLITFQSILRSELIKDGRTFNVFAPTTIKSKFSGIGTSNKDNMCKVFTHYDIENNNIKKIQNLIENCVKNRQAIKKPIDDIVDAFAIAKISSNDIKPIERIQRDKTKEELKKSKKTFKSGDDFLNSL